MLSVIDIFKTFGERVLLKDIRLSVFSGERVALVGRNGCGKTTLLRIISGEVKADRGTVALTPGTRIGYLGQEGQLATDRTVYQEMRQVFAAVFELEQQLRTLEESMASLEGRSLEQCLEEYGRLQAQYEHAEPLTIDARIRTVLAGLGFTPVEIDRPCGELSGGWQMRAAMARILLWSPDLLLLDEPTNHLDVSAVEWLEEFLASYPGAVLMVSHDRAFLDRAINRIVELSGGELEEFAGNYTYYLEEADRRMEQQIAAYKNQQKKLAQDMRFIERFRYKATLASRVKSREKLVAKREKLELPELEPPSMKVGFEPCPDSGREALILKNVAKSYPNKPVLKGVSLELARGERVALVGRNGAGKSTLLRLLAGLEQPDSGSLKIGYRLRPVYYAQHQAEALRMDLSVLEEVRECSPPGMTETALRNLLGCLLFSGDDVFKPVGVLSGGERSRVALARCVVTPSNLLMLDEPTNHLDLQARESLLSALSEYPGSLILITHDRYFMNELATQIWEVEGGQVRSYLGNYEDYRRAKAREAQVAASKAAAAAAAAPRRTPPKPTVRTGAAAPPKKHVWKLEALEARIFRLEDELAGLAAELADPDLYRDAERARQKQSQFDERTRECQELTAIWDEMTIG